MTENNTKEKNSFITVLEVLKKAIVDLDKNNIIDARLNAELLLCNVMNCKRLDLYVNYEKPVKPSEENEFRKLILRRISNEPIQYILGKTNFFGYDITLDRNVLIPRQETELLVERVLEDISSSEKKSVSIFEIGTGSGCIVIALSKRLSELNILYELFSIDISEKALITAKKNLELNGISGENITLYCKDVFDIPKLKKKYDYIVSNPPYISMNNYQALPEEIRNYEPKNALTDDKNGLNFFNKIFEIFSDSEFSGKMFCEIGYGQKESLEVLLKKYEIMKYKFYKDYSNIFRILKAEK
ncbi:MAG: peptide chain release factor N(5)-glutamine methyltransferase [Ignavibacteria bacterium]